MRRIVNSTYVSLDGVIEHLEQWHFDYFDDDAGQYAWEVLSASDALLMGRLTYEGFVDAWSSRSGEFADKINGMRKYVASTTLDKVDWNNSALIEGDLVLDELRLWVHPVLAGVGERVRTSSRDPAHEPAWRHGPGLGPRKLAGRAPPRLAMPDTPDRLPDGRLRHRTPSHHGAGTDDGATLEPSGGAGVRSGLGPRRSLKRVHRQRSTP